MAARKVHYGGGVLRKRSQPRIILEMVIRRFDTLILVVAGPPRPAELAKSRVRFYRSLWMRSSSKAIKNMRALSVFLIAAQSANACTTLATLTSTSMRLNDLSKL